MNKHVEALPSIATLCERQQQSDPVFESWVQAQPDKHWAKFDLSALRVGYELGKAALSAEPKGTIHPVDWDRYERSAEPVGDEWLLELLKDAERDAPLPSNVYDEVIRRLAQPQRQGRAVAVVGERGSVSWRSDQILPIGTALYTEQPASQGNSWPFQESPGVFADRLQDAYLDLNHDWVAAVRHVLIENPPIYVRQPASAAVAVAASYLRQIEWQMGNGQCPECGGNLPGAWAPHPCVPTPADEGHAEGCELAAAIAAVGDRPDYATTERAAVRCVGPIKRNQRRVQPVLAAAPEVSK